MSDLTWDKLLSKERFRESKKEAIDHRSEFERDFDRVVFSSLISDNYFQPKRQLR